MKSPFDTFVVLSREWDGLGEEAVNVFSTHDKARAFLDKLIEIAYASYRVVDDGMTLHVYEEFNEDDDSDWLYMVEILPTNMDKY